MEKEILEKKMEQQAADFRRRSGQRDDLERRHDIIKEDEKKAMLRAFQELSWSYSRIGGLFDRDPRQVRYHLENMLRVKETKKLAIELADIDVDKALDSYLKRWQKTLFLHKDVHWNEKEIGNKLDIPIREVRNDLAKAAILMKTEAAERSLIIWVREAGRLRIDPKNHKGGRRIAFTLGNCSDNVLTVERIYIEVISCIKLDLPSPIEAEIVPIDCEIKLRPEAIGEYSITNKKFRFAGRDGDDFDLVCDSLPGFMYRVRLKVIFSDLETRKQFTSYSDTFSLCFYKTDKLMLIVSDAQMAELKAKERVMITKITESMIREWELLSAARKSHLANGDLFDSLLLFTAKGLIEIHKFGTGLEDCEVAKYELAFVNGLFAKAVDGIPCDTEPIEHVVQEIEKLCAIPQIVVPLGLDYETKQRGIREFVDEVVLCLEDPSKNELLEGMFRQHEWAAQVQKGVDNKLLPEELRSRPMSMNLDTAERIKSGLREVTADWEHSISFIYDLWSLCKGTRCNTIDLPGDRLQRSVDAICGDTRLASVAKRDWVTIRNTLNDGRALFNQQKKKIEFRDVKRSFTWDLKRCQMEGFEIYLANLAMLYSVPLLNATVVRKWIETLKNRAK